MSEPDHLWLRPMPNLMRVRPPAVAPQRPFLPTGFQHSFCTQHLAVVAKAQSRPLFPKLSACA